MAKLDDISKNKVFNVPEDYFDKLPAQIHSRVSTVEPEKRQFYRFGLRYALPLLLILGTGIFFYLNSTTNEVESVLASVQTAELANYLNESEWNTEDLLEDLDLTASDLIELENLDIHSLYLDNIQTDEDLK